MFDGVEMPVSIMLSAPGSQNQFITSRVGRIYTQERPATLAKSILTPHTIRLDGYRIAKFGRPIEKEIYHKAVSQKGSAQRSLGKIAQNMLCTTRRHAVIG